MTSVQERGCPCWEHPFVTSFVVLSDLSLPPKSEFSKYLNGPSKTKPLVAIVPVVATNVPKYFEEKLAEIIMTVLEAQALASTLAPAPIISEVLRDKLKAHSPDVYHEKFHMDCYNFCQQCEDYFATIGATEPTQIPFAVSFP